MANNALITKSKFNREVFESKIPSLRDAYIIKEWLICQVDNPDRTEDFYFDSTLSSLQGKLTTITKDELNATLDLFLSDDNYYKRMQSTVAAMELAGV